MGASKKAIFFLGGMKAVGYRLNETMDLIRASEEGIPKKALLTLRDHLDMPMKTLAPIVGTSERSLQRLADDSALSPAVSENTLRIAKILEKGVDTFGTVDDFKDWLDSPNGAMRGRTPMSLLNSQFGCQLVMNVLVRIDYGVHS